MKLTTLRKVIIIGLSFGTFSSEVFSEKLNLSFLQGGSQITQDEMSAFEGAYVPGKYLVDVFFNDRKQGKSLLNIGAEEKNALCFPLSWLQQAGISINVDFYSSVFDAQRQCYIISDNKDSQVDFDFTAQSLSFSIPQKGLDKRKESLKDWDYGVPALRFDYNINGNVTPDNTSVFAYSGVKLNVEKWLLTTSASITEDSIDVPIATATRAIKDLEANLVVGKTFINNSLASGSGLLGIGINSDSSMSPEKLGYTPSFSGVARTHARVTLVQNNNVIYSEMVPPGPFDINNATLLGSGDVSMTITESDGKTTSQLFPIAIMPSMLSPGRWEYGFATGVRDNSDENKLTGLVSMGSLGYGFSQATVKGSLLYHPKYTSAGISLSRSLGFLGAISFESGLTRSLYDNGNSFIGNRISLAYSKTFETNTSLYINGSKYGGDDYIEFSSFTPWENNNLDGERQRYQYDLGISHTLSERLSVGGSGWMRDYGHGKTVGLNGRASMRFEHFSLGVGSSYSKTKTQNDYALSFSVSIPLSSFGKEYNSYSNINITDDGQSSYSIGVSASKDKWDYSVSTGRGAGNDMTYSANLGYQGDRAAIRGQVSQTGSHATGSASLSGSVIALTTPDVIFTRNTTDTIAIANVKNTAGVQFISSPYPTNGRGNAVIPVTSYAKNDITLEGSSLPLDTELLTTNETIIPTRGAVVYVPFGAVKVQRYLLQIKRKDGNFIQNGTWATTDAGAPIGFIAQNGVLFISSLDKPSGIKLGECLISGSVIKETTELQEVFCEN